MDVHRGRQVLIVRCAGRACALRVEDVVETLRPLPIAPLAGTAPFVAGAAVLRGEPVPVVDLAAFLGEAARRPPARLVVVRCGARHAALAVDAVVGVAALGEAAAPPAPLLAAACAGAVDALAGVDGELLVVLRAAQVVPEGTWRALDPERRP